MDNFFKYFKVSPIAASDDIEKGAYEESELKGFENNIKIRFLVSLAVTVIFSVYSLGHLGSLIVSSFIMLYGALVFIYPAYENIRKKRVHSFFPLSVAILILYFFAVFSKSADEYFNVVNSLVAFSLFGYWLEIRKRIKTREIVRSIFGEKLSLIFEDSYISSNGFLKYFSAVSLLAGAIIFYFWSFSMGLLASTSLAFALSAILILSPRAVNFSSLFPAILGEGLCVKRDIFVKNRLVFYKAFQADSIVFIKTKILTTGQFKVSDVVALEGFDKMGLLREQASLEAFSTHPVSQAVVEEAKKQHLDLTRPQNVQAIRGEGVQGILNNKKVLVGSSAFMKKNGIDISSAEKHSQKFLAEGKNISFIAVNGKLAGLTAVYDEIRPAASIAVKKLKDLGFEVRLITGDSKENALEISKQLGIEKFFGGALQDEKISYIVKIQSEGKKVAVVGDAETDAPVLGKADFAVKISSAHPAPQSEKETVLKNFDPMDVFSFFEIAGLVSQKIKQNVIFASAFGVLFFVLASGALYIPYGIYIPVDFASFLAFIASIVVISNSLLLKKYESR